MKIYHQRVDKAQHDGLLEVASLLPLDSKIVEIGCFAGESAELWVSCDNISIVNCIDPWGHQDTPNWTSEQIELSFDIRMSETTKIRKYKMMSLEAIRLFEDRSLDLVFVDGCHDLVNVTADINGWLPKIKFGGIMAIHDYNPNTDVEMAVNTIFGKPDRIFQDTTCIKYIKDIQ